MVLIPPRAKIYLVMMLFLNLGFRFIDVASIRNLNIIEIIADTIRISQIFYDFKSAYR